MLWLSLKHGEGTAGRQISSGETAKFRGHAGSLERRAYKLNTIKLIGCDLHLEKHLRVDQRKKRSNRSQSHSSFLVLLLSLSLSLDEKSRETD